MNMKLPYVEQFHQNRQKVKQKDPPGGSQSAAVAAQNDQRNRGRQEPNSYKMAQPAGLANNTNQAGQPQFANGAVGGAGSERQAVAGGKNAAGSRAIQVQQLSVASQQQSKRRDSNCGDEAEAGRQKVKSIKSKQQKNESQDSLIGPNSLNNGVQGMQAPEPKDDNNKDIRFQSGLKVKSQVVSNNGGGSNLKSSSRLAGVNSSRASARNRDPKNYASGGGF